MLETDEIVITLDHLRGVLDDLVMRGLSSVSDEQIHLLKSIKEECERIGAGYIASSVGTVLDGITSDPAAAASALMKAQAGLRVFERVLTLDYVQEALEMVIDEEGAG